MAPFTGPAASIGLNQVDWAYYYRLIYNKTHKTKIAFVNEDTMLGSANGTAEAVKGAQALGSNASVLGVVGPAGSNEVKATTGALKGAGLGLAVGRDGVSQSQSDFSAIINKIPRDTQLVYLPWQLPPKGKAFGQQMKSLGRGSVKLMGSDGLFDPLFSGVGSNVYDSFFPVNPTDKRVVAFKKLHGGSSELFGAPSYVAAQVVAGAIDRACKSGSASRASVRAQLRKTNISVKTSLLGLPLRFDGNGDMVKRPFGIYHAVKGIFVRVA
jgi:ABC-type branched-subunit amino acid transport system substrate-binding protein